MSTSSSSWLGKIADGFMAFVRDGLSATQKVLPFVAPMLPAAVSNDIAIGINDLTSIMGVVTNVEAVSATMKAGGAAMTASQKLAAAEPQVQAIIQNAIMVKFGKFDVKDQAGFTAGCQQIINGVVATLNAVGD